ncbi:MAG: phage holin family protein [Prevotella sp.]|nr:phage holin family protein [Prevotella sp.]
MQAILSTFSGWVSLLGVFWANFFAGYQSAIEAVVIVVTLDLAWAIASAIKRGTFAYSYLGKESVNKLSVYGSVIVGFVVLDKLVGMALPVTTIVVCLLISLVELWSMAGSMLIVFPNMPFLRLLRPILRGEMRIS